VIKFPKSLPFIVLFAPKVKVVLDINVPLKFTPAPVTQVDPIKTISQDDAPLVNKILIHAVTSNAAGHLKIYTPSPLSVILPDILIAQVIQ
jgi:hypothetical protein